MERLRYPNNHMSDRCGIRDQDDNNWPFECCGLNDHEDDPLGCPEITVSFNEGWLEMPIEPVAEEPEENMILSNYELEVPTYLRNSDLEEQVVPSGRLCETYKYPEELTISNNIENEDGLEDDRESQESSQENNGRYDPQPP